MKITDEILQVAIDAYLDGDVGISVLRGRMHTALEAAFAALSLDEGEAVPVGAIVDKNGGHNTASLPPTPVAVWFGRVPEIGTTLYSAPSTGTRDEVLRLRAALETIATSFHGSNPSLAYADAPREAYLEHVLMEARRFARAALASTGGDE
jgi:hypothetical protein